MLKLPPGHDGYIVCCTIVIFFSWLYICKKLIWMYKKAFILNKWVLKGLNTQKLPGSLCWWLAGGACPPAGWPLPQQLPGSLCWWLAGGACWACPPSGWPLPRPQPAWPPWSAWPAAWSLSQWPADRQFAASHRSAPPGPPPHLQRSTQPVITGFNKWVDSCRIPVEKLVGKIWDEFCLG